MQRYQTDSVRQTDSLLSVKVRPRLNKGLNHCLSGKPGFLRPFFLLSVLTGREAVWICRGKTLYAPGRAERHSHGRSSGV